ncbi:MAG: hypothetical protein B7Z13_14215, partial [Caulobacterales bacterium 32-67-6]
HIGGRGSRGEDGSAQPEWTQRAGMEWLWRLAKEPRRLWVSVNVDF